MGSAELRLLRTRRDANGFMGERRAAVIGAGFSGTMTALHLKALLPPECQVLLCERGRFAHGAAYATPCADHLLNVRAANMSAFAAEPDQFADWLRARPAHTAGKVRTTPAGSFAPRNLYGQYLAGLLDGALTEVGPTRLQLQPFEVIDLEPCNTGYQLLFKNGSVQRVGAAILAVGNLPLPPTGTSLHCNNPWEPASTAGLQPDLPVLIVGTGLTMIDLVVQLRSDGFTGKIIALSRRGLLPHRHRATAPWAAPHFPIAERRSLLAMLRRLREEVRAAALLGVDWRSVLDSLRPLTSDLWCGLPEAERTRFLRHVRSYWDVHRHRVAEPLAEQIDALRGWGDLIIHRGRIVDMRLGKSSVDVTCQRRPDDPTLRFTVQRVINATGLAPLGETSSPLLSALKSRGLVRVDALGLGLDVTSSLQAIDARGRATPNLWAIGPLVRGALWECTAVPDIRVHAERIARAIGASLQESPGRAPPLARDVNGEKSATLVLG